MITPIDYILTLVATVIVGGLFAVIAAIIGGIAYVSIYSLIKLTNWVVAKWSR